MKNHQPDRSDVPNSASAKEFERWVNFPDSDAILFEQGKVTRLDARALAEEIAQECGAADDQEKVSEIADRLHAALDDAWLLGSAQCLNVVHDAFRESTDLALHSGVAAWRMLADRLREARSQGDLTHRRRGA